MIEPEVFARLRTHAEVLGRRGRGPGASVADDLRSVLRAAEDCQDGGCPTANEVVDALMEVGGWDEVDGDGSPEGVLADHIRRLPGVLADLAEQSNATEEFEQKYGYRGTRS